MGDLMSEYTEKRWKYLKNTAKKIGHHILTIDGTDALLNKWAIRKGFDNYLDYMNCVAIRRGFTCYNEYMEVRKYYPGMPDPYKENRRIKQFIGYVGENGILQLFEGSKKMKRNNPGYDIICPRGYKLDVKTSVLSRFNTLLFKIDKNQIADYFILVAFDNVIDLKPINVWVLKSDDTLRDRFIKNIDHISIFNDPKSRKLLDKFSRIDKLEELKKVCEEFSKHSSVEICDDNVPTRSHILDIRSKIKLEGKKDIMPQDILNVLKAEPKKRKILSRLQLVPEEDCR